MNSYQTARSSGFTHKTQLNLKKTEYGFKNLRQRTGLSQPQNANSIDIPKEMLTAPFLQYSALTPGQKRYLCSVREAYSEAHMRMVMQQHYLNVLRRSIKTGNMITNKPLRRNSPDADHSSTRLMERPDGAQKGKSTDQKSTFLPKINSQIPKRSPELIPKMEKGNYGLI